MGIYSSSIVSIFSTNSLVLYQSTSILLTLSFFPTSVRMTYEGREREGKVGGVNWRTFSSSSESKLKYIDEAAHSMRDSDGNLLVTVEMVRNQLVQGQQTKSKLKKYHKE